MFKVDIPKTIYTLPIRVILFCIVLMMPLLSNAQWLRTEGKTIIDFTGQEVLLRGMGPGGWLIMEGYMMQTAGIAGAQHEIRENLIELMGEDSTNIFFEKWRENHFTKRDVDSLAAWGFNSIRIPLHYNLFTLPIEEEPVAGEHTWFETGFDLIDSVLKWSEPHDIYVILDLHAAPGGQGTGSDINDYDPDKPSLWESQENKDKTVALWKRIAERYSDEPWIGGYDLINEPHWDLPGGRALRQLYGEITDSIRTVDSLHILFIEGNWYANDFTGLRPPWDDNMVYSFHKYWTYNDSSALDWVLPLRNQYNIPLWMGESGENSNTWFRDAVKLFEDNNIGWAWWTMRKVGDIDSPYDIELNPEYQKVIDYWAGNGPRPSAHETFNGMMQLAEDLLIYNSQFRKDIPDALIRQVQSNECKPYSENEIPGLLYMPNFDLGRNGYAYFDTDVADYNLSTGTFQAWNSGWSYRNDGVDIEKNNLAEGSNGYHIGFIQKGEWMNYTVDILETGAYSLDALIASPNTGGEFHLSINGVEVTKTLETNNTGSWSNFQALEIHNVLLEAGEKILRFEVDGSTEFNIASINFERTGESNNVAFSAINGVTNEDSKSVFLTFNKDVSFLSVLNEKDHLILRVNGENYEIQNITEESERRILIHTDKLLRHTDEITLSYEASAIISENQQFLSPFVNLAIRNTLPFRFIIPGKIEAESFISNSGLTIESTTDIGGGSNIGYTDAGDFANYLVFIEENGEYNLSLRVAAQSQNGKLGLSLLDEDKEEIDIASVDLPVTDGWQNWVTLKEQVELNAGENILKLKILKPGFNLNWIDFEKIEETLIEQKIIALPYPNPASQKLYIPNDAFESYELYSLAGLRISAGEINQTRCVSVKNIRDGMYILILYDKETGTSEQHRIVILHSD